MRVVYLNPSGQLGGAEIALLDLLSSIRAARPGCSLHLIAGAEGPLLARAAGLGVSASALPFPPALARLGDAGLGGGGGGPTGAQVGRAEMLKKLFAAGSAVFRYTGELRRAIKEARPDIIHTNGFKMHVLGLRARTRKATPVIWHVRDYVGTRPLMARLLRWHAGACAAVVTNSESVAADVRAVCGGDDLKVYPVHDAIDLERFTPSGKKLNLDALAGLPEAVDGTLRVGLLATMARWKGHLTFLQALALLPPELKVRGYLIGGALYQTDGSQYTLDELRDEVARLGLAGKVGLTDYVEDAASAIRALDIVVHASTQPEPFGLVIAEAMACGRALVASLAGGAAEIINPGTDALGHSPADAEALARCLRELLTDAGLRERLGRNARLSAEKRFDRARLAGQLMPIYEEALSDGN